MPATVQPENAYYYKWLRIHLEIQNICQKILKWCYYKSNHPEKPNLGRVAQWVKALQMNRKVPGWNITRRSASFSKPTSLWGPLTCRSKLDNLAPRALKKKQLWHCMISREIFTWFDLSIVRQSELIYAMLWIFHNG